MSVEYWALLIATVSLGFSIWSGFMARRATQFQRLSELRTKTVSLRWKMFYRLENVKEAAENAGLLKDNAKGNWKETITRLERGLRQADEAESRFAGVYNGLSLVPIVLPESIVESWHHGIDSITTSVDASQSELIPALKQSAEKMLDLLESQRQLELEAKNDEQTL